MKRIHLFEFEDFPWFPNWLRMCMTRFLNTFHRLLDTPPEIAGLVARALKHTKSNSITDLCSGAGGPMLKVKEALKTEHGFEDVKLTMTDLYPNVKEAKKINEAGDPNVRYMTDPVNARDMDEKIKGVRTMICSMHHMRPNVAKDILKDAKESKEPIIVFEISDNSIPIVIAFLAFPINILMTFFVTPFIRPMTWQQLVFTYLIPILPILIAWDGAVSNMRTYTLKDMDILLKDLRSDDYTWETGVIKNKVKKLYLLGLPNQDNL